MNKKDDSDRVANETIIYLYGSAANAAKGHRAAYEGKKKDNEIEILDNKHLRLEWQSRTAPHKITRIIFLSVMPENHVIRKIHELGPIKRYTLMGKAPEVMHPDIPDALDHAVERFKSLETKTTEL